MERILIGEFNCTLIRLGTIIPKGAPQKTTDIV